MSKYVFSVSKNDAPEMIEAETLIYKQILGKE